MLDGNDIEIVKKEADDTFQSINNLDDISDTLIIGTTFLLAALATWTTFMIPRFSNNTMKKFIFMFLVITCSLIICINVILLSTSLAPRYFYGDNVSKQIAKWYLPFSNSQSIHIQKEQYLNLGSESDIKSIFNDWLEEFNPNTSISSKESYEYTRFINYKLVAEKKAKLTSLSLILFYISLILFVIVIIYGLIATIV